MQGRIIVYFYGSLKLRLHFRTVVDCFVLVVQQIKNKSSKSSLSVHCAVIFSLSGIILVIVIVND